MILGFLDRTAELADLDAMLTRRHPSPASLMIVYGRRRVGKTELLRHWASRTGLPATYVFFEQETAGLQRKKLAAQILGLDLKTAPTFHAWSELWDWLSRLWSGGAQSPSQGQQRHILILDEVTRAAEADTAFMTSVQNAWDTYFKDSNHIIFLCGSQVHTMETFMAHGSPVFGRLTGQMYLEPFKFRVLREAFPKWTAEERVAAYACVGGVPAYLKWLNPELSMSDNIIQVMLNPRSMFLAEPKFLIYEELKRISTYQSIMQAIGSGQHTLDQISTHCVVPKNHLTEYLQTLEQLRFIERRVTVALPPAKRRVSRRGRYHFTDPYFRFYFEFLAPRQGEPNDSQSRIDYIKTNLRAFVGRTGFESLAREWTLEAGRAGRIGFKPEVVGTHASRTVQIDVLAINWAAKTMLVGECKWGDDTVGADVVKDLIGMKTPKLLVDLAAEDSDFDATKWTIKHALFTRHGLTPAARAELKKAIGLDVQLRRLDAEL